MAAGRRRRASPSWSRSPRPPTASATTTSPARSTWPSPRRRRPGGAPATGTPWPLAAPPTAAPRGGSRYWDPLATLGHLAALTEQIRLATHVLVLGYHHPLEIAK